MVRATQNIKRSCVSDESERADHAAFVHRFGMHRMHPVLVWETFSYLVLVLKSVFEYRVGLNDHPNVSKYFV